MIFSEQKSNLMYSVEFSPDLVQIQVRETVSGVFLAQMDIPIQVWHMVEVMRRYFNEHHMTQVPMTENQLEEMQMMEEVSDHVGMNYPEIPDSRFVAQPVDDFLFPWEEAGSAENPITIDEDEGSMTGGVIVQWLRNNDTSSSTTTTSNGTSSSSAFYREPPELFCCSTAL